MKELISKNGIKLFISPTENGFVCMAIEDEWMYSDEGYLCSVIARGMMKMACDNPQDTFEMGLDGFGEDIKNKKSVRENGEDNIPRPKGAKIIDIVPYFNKKKLTNGS